MVLFFAKLSLHGVRTIPIVEEKENEQVFWGITPGS